MFLKRLTCQGFKSFADKTEFDFGPGVTGIVGPNGCGKSNVVDAIKWVLGDQSARSLRGKQMMDVIFSGSGTRKTSSFAQVDLCFDNQDRRLAHDTDEVVISRLLYRSGESEYRINSEQVRLKDVRELFMDTGIGIGAYSIIEQGRVDVLLQANPQERRLIFEEAAGISRYKARKREAERKLDRVQQNLLRIEDIIEEVEKRLRSVKNQAGRARNFQQYDAELREKRSTYSLAEFHKHSQRQRELSQRIDDLRDQVSGLRTEMSSAEARDATLENELVQLEAELREVEQRMLSNTSEMTAHHERIEQSRERLTELADSRVRAQQRLTVERRRLAGMRQQIKTEEVTAAEVEGELQQANQAVGALLEEDRSLAEKHAELRARSEDEKAGIIDLMRQIAHLNNQVLSLSQRKEQLEAEKQRLGNRHSQVEAELDGLRSRQQELDERGRTIATDLQEKGTQLDVKREQASRLDADRAAIHQQLSAAKESRSGLMSRRQLLLDLDTKMEGVDAGVRELLHLKEQDTSGQTFGYVQGLVADLIASDVANAMLIETALGDMDQYLVVQDGQALMDDADRLGELPGRVRAICMDRVPPLIGAGRDFSGQPGFVANAVDVVRYPEAAERLVKHLLGRTIIVTDLAAAQRMAANNPPMFRYVTQSGELIEADGRCQLGPAGTGAGLISRKSELHEIDTQIAEVNERIESMSQQIEQADAEVAELERAQEALRSEIHETQKAEVENNSLRQSNEQGIHRLEQEQPLLESEIRSIDMQLAESSERSTQVHDELAEVEKQHNDRQDHARQLDEDLIRVGHDRSAMTERVTEAKVVVGQLNQRRSMVADRLRGLRDSLQASEEALSSSAKEAEDAAHRIVQTERNILNAESRLAELYASKELLDVEAMRLQQRRGTIRREQESLAGELKTKRANLEELETKLHERQMELQETRVRVESLCSRTQEELGIDLAEAYAEYEHAEQDWDALHAEIEELKEKIRRLGNVNLDAIAEQEELEQRSTFLGGQHEDLEKSRKQLEELIEELNHECRERFQSTFEAVRGHFQDLFRRLFGGGKADVLLEQAAEGQVLDVLEAGIEIQARPPGKELQSISLMSGGEKTMTAIALLLAIFRSRPSPFAVLDEVDAALDEANNERFNRIVGDFLDKSQFLIITHSKRTMSIADVLYGVTMQEAGVSRRVSVKFDSHESDGKAAVA